MQDGYYIELREDQRDRLLSQDFDSRIETLRTYAAEDALRVKDDVEETKPSEVRLQLNFGDCAPDSLSNSSFRILCKLDVQTYFGDYSDKNAVCELIAACKNEAQGQFLQSISWTTDSNDEPDILSMPFIDFMLGAVRSNGYHCDGEIALGIQPTSASVHGFDAFNLKLTQHVSAPSREATNG